MGNLKLMVRRGELVVVKIPSQVGFAAKTINNKPAPDTSKAIPIPLNFPGMVMDIYYNKVNSGKGSRVVISYYLVLFGGESLYVKPESLSAS